MKIYKNIFKIALLLLLFVPVNVSAQDANGSGNGLSISPTRNELVIERGESATVSLRIKNVSNVDILASTVINDFEPDGNTGNPNIIIDEDIESSASLKSFIVGLEDVIIKAGETEIQDIFVQVPENAAPGAYYGAIRYTSSNPNNNQEDAQLSLNASVASLLLVEVPGDITERIEISNVSALLNNKTGSLFTKKPNEVGVEINNLGNGFSKPFGKVSVVGPWGAGEILNYELNNTTPRGNVLPGNARLFKNELSGVTWPGKYTITANISHGRGGEVLDDSASFWYLPNWFIISVLFIVALIVGVAYFMVRKYKTRKTKR